MDLNKFIADAIRTESQIDVVKVNGRMLFDVLALHIASGQMLDQMKKHIFYGKEYNVDDFAVSYQNASSALTDLQTVPVAGTSQQMDEEEIEINPRVFHAIVGIATESTELCEALYSGMLNKGQLDTVNLIEENGDIAWYQAILIDELGGNWEDVLIKVIAKLKARYPDKFTSEDAINRDLDKEREVLEGK